MSGAKPLEGRWRKLVFTVLGGSGLPFLMRNIFQRRRLTVLLFHQQDPLQCDRSLRALKRRYSVITLGQALDALAAGSLATLPRRPLVLTLDDGRASNASLVPVFTRHGVRPTVFVTTGVVGTHRHFWWTDVPRDRVAELQAMPDDDRIAALIAQGVDPTREYDDAQALTLAQLQDLAAIADIEPHTRTHPVLTRCSRERVAEEVQGSAADVARLVGTQPRAFAYPNGAYSDEVAAIVGECGLHFALTTEPTFIDERSDPMKLGRIFIRDDAGISELLVCASGLQGVLKRALSRLR